MIRTRHLLCIVAVFALVASAQAQQPTSRLLPPTKLAVPKYYSIVGLGSSDDDPSIPLPNPTTIFQMHDTAHVRLIVRFPGLGLLGTREDTVANPTVVYPDTMMAFQAPDALMQLTGPETPYRVIVEVRDRVTGKILDTRTLPYSMDVKKFWHKPITYLHPASAGYSNKTLRRRFSPKLLPFDLETNPGWNGRESIDSLGTYALEFREPTDSVNKLFSITIRPAEVGDPKKKDWEKFKKSARETFGEKGIAVATIGDCKVDDRATRKLFREGYEFVAKQSDGGVKYIVTFLTPHAIILLVAVLDDDLTELSYNYFRAIARSFRIPPEK